MCARVRSSQFAAQRSLAAGRPKRALGQVPNGCPDGRYRLATGPLVMGLLLVVATVGCGRSSPAGASRGQTALGQQQRAENSEALYDVAVGQLRNLPSYVNTELRPPVVVLDSTKSREAREGGEGQDILATLTTHPEAPDGLINYLSVPEGNSLFRVNGVKPGDVVRYFVQVDEESLEAGFTEIDALELNVAQVLSENALLIEGGLNQPNPVPAKIEVWRYVDDRLEDIRLQLARYVARRLPPVGWEPSPDQQALERIVDLLNQWLRQSQPKTDWQVDAIANAIDESLANDESLAEYVSPDSFGQQYFRPYDGRRLQEAVWLRDIGRWARGESFDEVGQAAALFDWMVRNVQLDVEAPAHRPWQVLLFGRGTAEQRAWVFALLCRQQGLEVVVLELPEAADQESDAGVVRRFWLPALVSGGELYLFDTRLGLPIPGPGGEGVATLRQLQSDEALVRHLDLDDTPYPVTADLLGQMTVNFVADEFDLSRRARLLESRLSGDDRLVLAARSREVIERLTKMPGVVETDLWDLPYQTLQTQLNRRRPARLRVAISFEPFAWRPMLWKARVLHFRGRQRPAETAAEEIIDDHRLAAQAYTDPVVRPPVRLLNEIASPEKRKIYESAKRDATYWVGLLLFDDGKLDAAQHWLGRQELTAHDSPWLGGARYNLARTYEAQGKIDEAIALYRADTSPQRQGNMLRARWLESRSEEP